MLLYESTFWRNIWVKAPHHKYSKTVFFRHWMWLIFKTRFKQNRKYFQSYFAGKSIFRKVMWSNTKMLRNVTDANPKMQPGGPQSLIVCCIVSSSRDKVSNPQNLIYLPIPHQYNRDKKGKYIPLLHKPYWTRATLSQD